MYSEETLEEIEDLDYLEKQELLEDLYKSFGLKLSMEELEQVLDYFGQNPPPSNIPVIVPELSSEQTPSDDPLVLDQKVEKIEEPKAPETLPKRATVCHGSHTIEGIRHISELGYINNNENTQGYSLIYQKYKFTIELTKETGGNCTVDSVVALSMNTGDGKKTEELEFKLDVKNENKEAISIWWYYGLRGNTQEELGKKIYEQYLKPNT